MQRHKILTVVNQSYAMADFEEHRRAAILAGLIISIDGGYILFVLGYQLATIGVASVLLFAVTVVVGLAPDIDVWSSIPRRYFGYILLAGLPVGAIYKVVTEPELAVSVGESLWSIVGINPAPPVLAGSAFFVVGAVGIAKVVGYSVDEFVTHRGRFHTVSFWATIGTICGTVGHLYYDVPFVIAAVVGVAVVIGAIVHIKIVDEM
jgi:hypothetical protein